MQYNKWLKTGASQYFKRRRFSFLDEMTQNALTNSKQPLKVLDIGCASGKDFLSFAAEYDNIDLYGLDIKEYPMEMKNVHFIVGDAEKMDFPDKYFDITVSIGVLEHIQPIEKLARMIQEIDRVSKTFYMIMPSVSTPYEPHTHQFFWALKKSRKFHPWLLFFDDLTWLKFTGFEQAAVKRMRYIPGLITNICVYKNEDSIKISQVEHKLWEKIRY